MGRLSTFHSKKPLLNLAVFAEALQLSYFLVAGPFLVASENFAMVNLNYKMQLQAQTYEQEQFLQFEKQVMGLRGDLAFNVGHFETLFLLGNALGILFW